MASDMLLELRHIELNYDSVSALRDISMHLEQGDVVALIGANGAGKSSTLRAITGLRAPQKGEVWFDGQRIDGRKPHEIVGLGIAMVPEGRRIWPHMSVRDNLLLGAYLRREKAAIQSDLEKLFVRFPRLKERWKQAAGSLSGGEQQMVSIGRALMARPRLLLLDEPSLGLAPMMVRQIASAVTAVNREDKVSVVLVEQNSRMALKISHRAYVLETGKIALQGASKDLLENDQVRKLYLGG